MLYFAVSCTMQHIEIVHKGEKSLQNLCKDLDVATSNQQLKKKVVDYYYLSRRRNVSRRLRVSLEEEVVLGEEVWVVDLTLESKKEKHRSGRNELLHIH